MKTIKKYCIQTFKLLRSIRLTLKLSHQLRKQLTKVKVDILCSFCQWLIDTCRELQQARILFQSLLKHH